MFNVPMLSIRAAAVCVFLVVLISSVSATASQNYYCADLRPQAYVDIDQLMGMWFGLEIINHRTVQYDAEMTEDYDSCPVIHLSQAHDDDESYENNRMYGQTYPQHNSDQYNQQYHQQYHQQYNSRGSQYRQNYRNYGSQTAYPSETHYTANNDGYYDRTYTKMTESYPRSKQIKKLRLLWSEYGKMVEYNLHYDENRAGFWISGGPQNGSFLEKPYNQFAGVVQVIKAVSSHLVLTFCHVLPDKQLFTALLSRDRFLSNVEITGVHNMLNRINLSTTNAKKGCMNGAIGLELSYLTFFTILVVSMIGNRRI